MSVGVTATLADLLPEHLDGMGKHLKAHLAERGPGFGWSFLQGQAIEGLRGSLKDVDLLGELAKAWVTLKVVRGYKETTAGKTAVVPLGEHGLNFSATPVLKLKIAEVELPELKFTYTVRAAFDQATLSVRDGTLVAAAPGDCVFTLGLKCGEVDVRPPWTLAKVQLPSERSFDPGWKIP